MSPDRIKWGPYCRWPRPPGPYIHIVYPVGHGCIMDEGVLRELTGAELDDLTEKLFDPSLYFQQPTTPRHDWDHEHEICRACRTTVEELVTGAVGEFCPGPPDK